MQVDAEKSTSIKWGSSEIVQNFKTGFSLSHLKGHSAIFWPSMALVQVKSKNYLKVLKYWET